MKKERREEKESLPASRQNGLHLYCVIDKLAFHCRSIGVFPYFWDKSFSIPIWHGYRCCDFFLA